MIGCTTVKGFFERMDTIHLIRLESSKLGVAGMDLDPRVGYHREVKRGAQRVIE